MVFKDSAMHLVGPGPNPPIEDYMIAQAYLKPLAVKAGGMVSVTLDFVLLDDGANGQDDGLASPPTYYEISVRSKKERGRKDGGRRAVCLWQLRHVVCADSSPLPPPYFT